MNPIFECDSKLSASELAPLIADCNLPALITDDNLHMIAKNAALKSGIVKYKKGAQLSAGYFKTPLDTLKHFDRGCVRYLEVLIPVFAGATVARFEDCFLFLFKPKADNFFSQAASMAGLVSRDSYSVLNLDFRFNDREMNELELHKSLLSSHILRQSNACYLIELASADRIRQRDSFEPSALASAVCNAVMSIIMRCGIELNNQLEVSLKSCYGTYADFYAIVSAMLAFAAENTLDGMIGICGTPNDTKYVLQVAFKSRISEKRMMAFRNAERPFRYNSSDGMLSEKMMFMQCVAESNGWYFCARHESGLQALTLTLPTYDSAPAYILKSSSVVSAYDYLATAQFAGINCTQIRKQFENIT